MDCTVTTTVTDKKRQDENAETLAGEYKSLKEGDNIR